MGHYTTITDGLQLFYHLLEKTGEKVSTESQEGKLPLAKMKIHLLREANWLMMGSSLLIPLAKHTNHLRQLRANPIKPHYSPEE